MKKEKTIRYPTSDERKQYAMQYRIAQLEALVMILADELGYIVRQSENGPYLKAKEQ